MKKQFYVAKMVLFFAVMAGGVVKTQAQCTAVTSMTPGALTCSTAYLAWTPVSGAMGYEYKLDMSMSDPAGAGIMVMDDTVTASALSPSTAYYVHVRAMCMSGYSPWATLGMVTTPACFTCTAPASVTTTPGAHNVNLSWGTVSGSTGYEYIVNTNMADPTGAGTAVTSTSANVTGLTASTAYYAHTRSKCGGSSYSPWSTAKSFSTSVSTGVNTVNSNEFSLRTYPNPVSNTLTVEVNGCKVNGSSLQVMGIDGRIVKSMQLANNITEIDLGGLSNGLYFVKYSDGSNKQTVKINKQ